jgi:Putative cyclase
MVRFDAGFDPRRAGCSSALQRSGPKSALILRCRNEGHSLSERRLLSGPWDSADPVYKVESRCAVQRPPWPSAQDLWEEIGARNPRFRSILEHFERYKADQQPWFRVSEDNFAISMAHLTHSPRWRGADRHLSRAYGSRDVVERAAADPDHRLSPEDLAAHERAHGRILPRACVALRSGWDAHLGTPRFRNADASGAMRFPGFLPDTAPLLLERGVADAAVDTLSLDHGGSRDFGFHWPGSALAPASASMTPPPRPVSEGR